MRNKHELINRITDSTDYSEEELIRCSPEELMRIFLEEYLCINDDFTRAIINCAKILF